jgi:hypothetical protein
MLNHDYVHPIILYHIDFKVTTTLADLNDHFPDIQRWQLSQSNHRGTVTKLKISKFGEEMRNQNNQ